MRFQLQKIVGFISVVFCVLSVQAGIYRHDRSKEAHMAAARQKKFDCVGQIYKNDKPGASCVLIDKNVVLSAAHCFYNDGRLIDVKRYSFCFNRQKYPAKRIIVHEKYKGQCYDICLIELDKSVTDIAPAVVCETFDELHSVGTSVGFGYICQADKPDDESKSSVAGKFAGENTIDSIGGDLIYGRGSVLYADFDCPPNCKYCGKCNKMGSQVPLNMEFSNNSGDSGGGLFRNGKQGLELIGIVRGGGVEVSQFVKTFYYGQLIEWTRVSTFSKWIKDQR